MGVWRKGSEMRQRIGRCLVIVLSVIGGFVIMSGVMTSVISWEAGGYTFRQQVQPTQQEAYDLIFFALSDLHYDPYYNSSYGPDHYCRKDLFLTGNADCLGNSDLGGVSTNSSLGQIGCNPPLELIDSLFADMYARESDPLFILYGGDFASHCMTNDADTGVRVHYHLTKEVLKVFKSYFPQTTFIPTLGNHDFSPNGQLPFGENEFLSMYGDLWREYIGDQAADSVQQNGYYRIDIDEADLSVLAINSLFYSKGWCSCNTTLCKAVSADDIDCLLQQDDPNGQMSWIEAQLEDCKQSNRSAFILGHISPGFSRSFHPQWESRFQETFFSVVEQYSDVITGMFFAHNHRDSLELFYPSNAKKNLANLFILPSITPIDLSFPTYRMNYYSNTHGLVDYQQIYLNMSKVQLGQENAFWEPEYNFHKAYLQNPTPDGTWKVYEDLEQNNNHALDKFLTFWPVSYFNDDQRNFSPDSLLCTIRYIENNQTQACIDEVRHGS